MLQTILQGIPAAASSPLALAAYAMALAVWALIAWRTMRSRNLLTNLQKLPKADRLAALKAEMGHVELKEGLSPEQWLKSRMQSYLLIAFAILCVTGVVVLAMASQQKPKKPDVDLTLYEGPSLDATMAEDDAELSSEPRTTLKYRYRREGDLTVISPAMPYLEEVASGAYVQPIGDAFEAFRANFPELSFKVVNNSDRTLLLNEVVVEVKASEPDVSPLLYVQEGAAYGTFRLINDGWGPAQSPVLKANFGLACDVRTPPATPTPVKAVDREAEVNIAALVPPEVAEQAWNCGDQVGAVCADGGKACASLPQPVTCLQRGPGDRCEAIAPEDAQGAREALVTLGSTGQPYLQRVCEQKPVCVVGELAYRTKDGKAGRFRFQTPVFLGDGGGLGAPSPPTYRYHLKLKAGQAGYTERISIAQQLKPGEADHFILKVGTDKSASYDLVFRVMGNGDEPVATFPVRMELVLPTSVVQQLAQRAEAIRASRQR